MAEVFRVVEWVHECGSECGGGSHRIDPKEAGITGERPRVSEWHWSVERLQERREEVGNPD